MLRKGAKKLDKPTSTKSHWTFIRKKEYNEIFITHRHDSLFILSPGTGGRTEPFHCMFCNEVLSKKDRLLSLLYGARNNFFYSGKKEDYHFWVINPKGEFTVFIDNVHGKPTFNYCFEKKPTEEQITQIKNHLAYRNKK